MNCCRLLLIVLAFVATTASAAVDRTKIDAAYREELRTLATKCESLGLREEAEVTRRWFVERLSDRQYFFVPVDRSPPAPAEDLQRKWHDKFVALRMAQADRLFALSRQYLDDNDPSRAYQVLYEVVRENPDHGEARAILGFRKGDGVWRVPGATTGTRKASLAHGLVKDFKAGTYWRVNSSHFQVSTDAGAAEGQRFAEQLERLHTVWRQAFFRYWSSDEELKARFATPAVAAKPKKAFDVVLFKTRDQYLANLGSVDPRLAVTQGIYLDKQATAFFYLADTRTEAICNHEVTHQLFQEVGDPAREVGATGNFWIVEGIALYMESLRTFSHAGAVDVVTLGGWDADRLQFARHHVYNGQYQLPLQALSGLTRKELQDDPDIKRLYSQSAGVAHYLMDGDNGTYRQRTVTYLAGVYAGKAKADALAQLTETPFAKHDGQYREYLRVTDSDLATMEAPQAIRNLCLGHQPITDEGLAKVAACENLRWLDLAATHISDQGLAPLAALKQLDQINLEQTSISDATLVWLGKETQLRELDLSHTKITDSGVARLGGLANLKVLWLTGTPITNASAATLQRFRKLTILDLEDTRLTPASIEKLKAALESP